MAHPNATSSADSSGPAAHVLRSLASLLIDFVESPAAARLWIVGTTEKLENMDPRVQKANR